jgi:hypothetical protein
LVAFLDRAEQHYPWVIEPLLSPELDPDAQRCASSMNDRDLSRLPVAAPEEEQPGRRVDFGKVPHILSARCRSQFQMPATEPLVETVFRKLGGRKVYVKG